MFAGRRADGLNVIDATVPAAMKLLTVVPGSTGTNGAIMMQDLGVGASANGAGGAASATFFRLSDGAAVGGIAFPPGTGGPDAGALRFSRISRDLSRHRERIALLSHVCISHTFLSSLPGVYVPAVLPGAPSLIGFTMTHPSVAGGDSSFAVFGLNVSALKAAAAPGAPPCGNFCATPLPGGAAFTLGATPTATLVPVREGGLEGPKPAGDGATAWVGLEGGAAAARVALLPGTSSSASAVMQLIDLRPFGCATPTGVDIDTINARLFVACRGGDLPGSSGLAAPVFLVVNVATGKLVYKSSIGHHVDGASPPEVANYFYFSFFLTLPHFLSRRPRLPAAVAHAHRPRVHVAGGGRRHPHLRAGGR